MTEQLIKIEARATTLPRRCRGGHCFSREWSEVEVTEDQLQAIHADPHLEMSMVDPSAQLDPDQLTDEEKVEELANAIFGARFEKSPNVKDAAKLVDFKVNADLRDAAWAVVEKTLAETMPANDDSDAQPSPPADK